MIVMKQHPMEKLNWKPFSYGQPTCAVCGTSYSLHEAHAVVAGEPKKILACDDCTSIIGKVIELYPKIFTFEVADTDTFQCLICEEMFYRSELIKITSDDGEDAYYVCNDCNNDCKSAFKALGMLKDE